MGKRHCKKRRNEKLGGNHLPKGEAQKRKAAGVDDSYGPRSKNMGDGNESVAVENPAAGNPKGSLDREKGVICRKSTSSNPFTEISSGAGEAGTSSSRRSLAIPKAKSSIPSSLALNSIIDPPVQEVAEGQKVNVSGVDPTPLEPPTSSVQRTTQAEGSSDNEDNSSQISSESDDDEMVVFLASGTFVTPITINKNATFESLFEEIDYERTDISFPDFSLGLSWDRKYKLEIDFDFEEKLTDQGIEDSTIVFFTFARGEDFLPPRKIVLESDGFQGLDAASNSLVEGDPQSKKTRIVKKRGPPTAIYIEPLEGSEVSGLRGSCLPLDPNDNDRYFLLDWRSGTCLKSNADNIGLLKNMLFKKARFGLAYVKIFSAGFDEPKWHVCVAPTVDVYSKEVSIVLKGYSDIKAVIPFCTLCCKKFGDLEKLDVHCRRLHPDPKLPKFQCVKCGFNYTRSDSLARHNPDECAGPKERLPGGAPRLGRAPFKNFNDFNNKAEEIEDEVKRLMIPKVSGKMTDIKFAKLLHSIFPYGDFLFNEA